jgi:ribonuclease-3
MKDMFMAESDLQEKLGYAFRDAHLLDLALTHSSWANERGLAGHNERLEFLGDAVLELCVSAALYALFPEAREGDLTRLRSQLVNTRVLADIARQCGLDAALRLGKGEEQQGGRRRDALLADAMEAVLGGIFLDADFSAAKTVVERLFAGHWPESVEPAGAKDFKSRLQEATQRLLRVLPVYALTGSAGPEHDKTFTVAVSLPDGRTWTGQASSVRHAEHEAARKALADLMTEN